MRISPDQYDLLYRKLVCDRVEDIPGILTSFIEAKIDLNTVLFSRGTGMLTSCIGLTKYHCLAYLLDLGLDPFILDEYRSVGLAVGWAAVHNAIIYSHDVSLRRLMGIAFTDPRFSGFEDCNGRTVEEYLARKKPAAQKAFRANQAIFQAYRDYLRSGDTALHLESPDYLIVALNYFLGAKLMKEEVADKEEDSYLKRFHLKKVTRDLIAATEAYEQAILVEKKSLARLEEFSECLELSTGIITSVPTDDPSKPWQIKLGSEEEFKCWAEKLGSLEVWLEETSRKDSTSSMSSGETSTLDSVEISAAGGSGSDEASEGDEGKYTDETPLLEGLRHRRMGR